jgi:ribosomal protein S12 methylthiotransferase accessory factor
LASDIGAVDAIGQWRWHCALGRGESGHKAFRLGTHRMVTPAQTIARLRPSMRQMGITRVANVTGLDRIGIPVVMVCRPNSRSIAVSQGKGLTLDAAKASGLMEAVETCHAERIDLPLKLGTYTDLRDACPIVDVDQLPPMQGSRFSASRRILWIEGQDLISGAPVWLPYEIVHTDYTLPLPAGGGCFAASTNGLASGNHLLEAINHGICEVVERDSTSIWNHLPKAARDRTRVELGSVDEESCARLLEQLERSGFATAVWDTTTDLGIASFYCLITDQRYEQAHSGGGAGCHPSRTVALLRALTEAVQVRTTYIAGSRDDLQLDEFTRPAVERKLARARGLMAGGPAWRNFQAVPSHESDRLADDLIWMLERLRSAGIEQVLAVDLTRRELGLPVVRIVIPGLEGADDHAGYLPGPRARRLRPEPP